LRKIKNADLYVGVFYLYAQATHDYTSFDVASLISPRLMFLNFSTPLRILIGYLYPTALPQAQRERNP
jgi:hypothetical protein